MSSFLKPSTPTKGRSSVKHDTPTDMKSITDMNSSIAVNNYSKLLEDVNALLYLESIKRNRDNEIVLKQQIEEAYKQFEERRYKYISLLVKYATLVKLASTRKVLLSNEPNAFPLDTARMDARNIKEKLSTGSATDYINTTELNKFKEILQTAGKYKNLPIRRSELVDLKNATDAIQCSIEAIEISLEKCITQGLDHYTDLVDIDNFPNHLQKFRNKE